MFKLYAILSLVSVIGSFIHPDPVRKGQCLLFAGVFFLIALSNSNG